MRGEGELVEEVKGVREVKEVKGVREYLCGYLYLLSYRSC